MPTRELGSSTLSAALFVVLGLLLQRSSAEAIRSPGRLVQPEWPQSESKRAQINMLQTRIGVHGSRLWQLPLTYLGVLVVSLSQLESKAEIIKPWFIFISLSLFGLLLLWCMYGAYEGYKRAVWNLIRVEDELGLTVTTANRVSHYVPYFGLLILGILYTIGAAAFFYAS